MRSHAATSLAGPAGSLGLLAVALLGVVHGWLPIQALRWLLAGLLVVTGLALWPRVRRPSRVLALVFLVLTGVAATWAPAVTLLEAAARASEIVALLVTTHFLADAVVQGGYDKTVRHLLTRMRWNPSLLAMAAGYVLSLGFSLTALPVVYSSLFPDAAAGGGQDTGDDGPRAGNGRSASGKSPDAGTQPANQGVIRSSPQQLQVAVLLARAFGSAGIISPVQPNVLLAVAVTGATFPNFLIMAAPLSLLMAAVAILESGLRAWQRGGRSLASEGGEGTEAGSVDRPAASDDLEAGTEDRPAARDGEEARRLPGPAPLPYEYVLLVGLFAALGAAILAVSHLNVEVLPGMSAAFVVVAAIGQALGRRLLSHRAPAAVRSLAQLAEGYSQRMADGVLLITAGSLAGFTLTHTPVMEVAAAQLARVQWPMLAAALTVVIVTALRVLGMPPAVIIITVGPVLAGTLPLQPVMLAALLSASTLFAFILSPFSITSAVVSSLTGRSPLEVSLPLQIRFALMGSLVVLLYVAAVS